MTRICFFNTVRFWGGGEKWHYEIAEYLSSRGHQVYFIAHPGGELHQRLSGTGITQFPLTLTNASFLNLYKIAKLITFFKANRIETVVFNGSSEVKIGAPAARMAGVRAIVYRRGVPVPVKNRLVNRILYGRLITHFLTNSRATSLKLFERLGFPSDDGKVRVIYNGVDCSHEAASSEPNPAKPDAGMLGNLKKPNGVNAIPGDSPIILGSAGRLAHEKGHDFLLDMAGILKEQGIPFQLRIAGEGPLRPSLEARIERMQLTTHVRLLGFVSDMRPFLRQLDIFILPSLWEGFGYAVAEAMAAGLPVVAFKVGSNPEVIEHPRTGFLVPPGNAHALAEKAALLARDPALRVWMGKNGQARVSAHFDRSQQMRKLESYLCREVLGRAEIQASGLPG